MLPHITGRPITMERFPAGIGKKGFIQKDVVKGFPELARAGRGGEARQGRRNGPLPAGRRRALAGVARQPELRSRHTCFATRVPRPRRSPISASSISIRRAMTPGRCGRRRWRCGTCSTSCSLPSFVKTSGSKGFHIVVPLGGGSDFEVFPALRARRGRGPGEAPSRPSSPRSSSRPIAGGGSSSTRAATPPAPPSPRSTRCGPKPGAPVSAPCTWPEVDQGAVGPRTFTLRTLAARLAEVGDLWRDIDGARAALDAPLRALEGVLSAEDWAESAAATTRRPTYTRKERLRNLKASRQCRSAKG